MTTGTVVTVTLGKETKGERLAPLFIMIYFTFFLLWLLNIFLSSLAHGIRYEWLSMQSWLLDQYERLKNVDDFEPETEATLDALSDINKWTKESLTFSPIITVGAQMLVLTTIISMLLFNESYIPYTIIAFVQSAAIVYTWIMVKRYETSRGMCYGVHINVEASKMYINTENDNDSEPRSTDNRRNE
jgi:hypothetical protein